MLRQLEPHLAVPHTTPILGQVAAALVLVLGSTIQELAVLAILLLTVSKIVINLIP